MTANVFGLAIGLTWAYPQGRWLFLLFAALAGLQRIVFEAHFPSDVLFAAGLGCAFGFLCVGRGPMSRAFDRWERYAAAYQAVSASKAK